MREREGSPVNGDRVLRLNVLMHFDGFFWINMLVFEEVAKKEFG